MDDETQKSDVRTKYFDVNQLRKEQTRSPIDSNQEEIQPSTFRKLLGAEEKYWTCTQASPILALPKSVLTFEAEGVSVRIFSDR